MVGQKSITAATPADWGTFLLWAAQEGWRVPQREVELFRDAGLGAALALREAEQLLGFVTCVAYEQSGWIGNLLVAPERRGAGCGKALFAAALAHLQESGCRHIWLTASQMGQPLYEQFGFVAVGRVQRWVRPAGATGGPRWRREDVPAPLDCDRRAWGESRAALLLQLTRGGEWCRAGETVLLLQQDSDMQILGPWYRGSDGVTRGLAVLNQALALASPHTEICCDLLNEPREGMLLAAAGFERRGENFLMVQGGVGASRLETMVALATLGSCG